MPFHLAAFSDQFVQALLLGILGMDARGQQALLAEFTIVAASPVVVEGFPDEELSETAFGPGAQALLVRVRPFHASSNSHQGRDRVRRWLPQQSGEAPSGRRHAQSDPRRGSAFVANAQAALVSGRKRNFFDQQPGYVFRSRSGILAQRCRQAQSVAGARLSSRFLVDDPPVRVAFGFVFLLQSARRAESRLRLRFQLVRHELALRGGLHVTLFHNFGFVTNMLDLLLTPPVRFLESGRNVFVSTYVHNFTPMVGGDLLPGRLDHQHARWQPAHHHLFT